jgi:cysteine desulfurase
MTDLIYLDNNATTILDPEVKQHLSCFQNKPYNPSSIHSFGKEAKKILTQARESIACILKVSSSSLYFTSGGTESLNMLIKGLYTGKGSILSTSIEHSCVHETLLNLKNQGADVNYVPVFSEGAPSLDAIQKHLSKDTTLMIFSAVYSETGAKLDLEAIAKLAHTNHVALVIDGVALLGKETFACYPGITGMGFSSHKLHGPKGVGLVYLAPGSHCNPLIVGGPQEKNLRAGTENLEGIYGFAKAVEILGQILPAVTHYIEELRNDFEAILTKKLKDIVINKGSSRICNTSNIYFPQVDAETLLIALDRHGICASAGSACSSGALEPSRVLLNMGLDRKRAKSSVRFSFSRFNTREETEKAAYLICEIVKKLSCD